MRKYEQNSRELIEQRVLEHGQLHMISQLCLDQICIRGLGAEVKLMLEKCRNLFHLSMSQCQLVSLKNIPELSSLVYLDLEENLQAIFSFFQRLNDQSLKDLPEKVTENLQGLNLSRNNLLSFESLIILLQKCPKLKELTVFGNQELQGADSIKTIFQRLFQAYDRFKNIEYVNSEDRQGKHFSRLLEEDSRESSQSGEQSHDGEDHSLEANNQNGDSQSNNRNNEDESFQKKVSVIKFGEQEKAQPKQKQSEGPDSDEEDCHSSKKVKRQ